MLCTYNLRPLRQMWKDHRKCETSLDYSMRLGLKKKKKVRGERPEQLETVIVKHFLSPNSLPIIIIVWPMLLLCKNKRKRKGP